MKKALKIITNVIAWAVLIIALVVTILVFSSSRNNGVANLFGYIPMTVESDSMLPTFAQGDLIICKQIDDAAALHENDVITFWTIIDGKKVRNTHRITAVKKSEGGTYSYLTRGDNNPIDDDLPVYAGDLIGKWTNVKLGGVGKAVNFLRTKTGFFVCILLPMAIFFLIELYKFIVTLIEVKRPAAEGPALDEEEIKRRAIEEYLAQQKQNEAKSADETKPAVETKSAEDTTSAEDTKPAEDTKSAEETTSAEETKSAEDTKSTEDTTSAEETKPADETKPAEETKPTEDTKSAEEAKSAEGEASAEDTEAAGNAEDAANTQ